MDGASGGQNGQASATARSQLTATIEGWQNSLVGMDRRNRLLIFKHAAMRSGRPFPQDQ